jgi:8-oxo-dGTP pyrophosphatase MutT (NUDIX family)
MATNSVETTIMINGAAVPVEYPGQTKETIELILREPKVANYFSKIHPDIVPNKVTLLSHYMFGRCVGFVFMNVVSIHKHTGEKLAGVVFLRGGSVACLILIKAKETGHLYFLKVMQLRVPVGKEIGEICAGMLDRELGKMSGVMVKEIEEETGIKVISFGKKNDNPLEQFNYLEELGQFYPSPGGCDEVISNFWFMSEMTGKEITALHGKNMTHDEDNSTENIRVEIEPFTLKNIVATNDAKAMCATLQLIAKYPGIMPRG